MAVNQDFKDLFKLLNKEKVEYLLVGAYALMFYAEPRFTKDIDIWVNPRKDNVKNLWVALEKFGAPLDNITIDDFCNEQMVYQIGIEPNRINILMGIDGVTFEEAWNNRVEEKYSGIGITVIGKKELIKNKKILSRKKDLLDLELLEGNL
jgi:hypothetical protein